MIYRYYADIGGWRFVVLIHKGRKWIRFIDQSTFQVYRRHARDLERLYPCNLKHTSVAGGMAKRRAMFKRCNVPFPKNAVREAIRLLREAGP